jgi:hypothetical protein
MGREPYTCPLIVVGRGLFTLSFEGPRSAIASWRIFQYRKQSELPSQPRNRGPRRMVPAHSMYPRSGGRR